MKKTDKLLIGVGIAAAVGLFIVYRVRRHQSNRRHAKVADEGYETAHDILFPRENGRRKKVHYGPILPE